MQDELWINGHNIDLSPNTVIGLTIQANDISDINSRQGNFSNVFKIPFTEKNRQFFESAENLNSATNVPYRQMVANYYSQGVAVILDGIAILEGTSEQGYEVRLLSGNVDFVKALGDITVGDLFKDSSCSGYEGVGEFHLMDIPTIVSSQSMDKDYFYPLVDFKAEPIVSMNTAFTIDATRMLPCVLTSTILNKITSLTGFTFGGSFIESGRHMTHFLTPDKFGDWQSESIKNFINDTQLNSFGSAIIYNEYTLIGTLPEAPTGDSFTYQFNVDGDITSWGYMDLCGTNYPFSGMVTMNVDYSMFVFIDMVDDPVLKPNRRKSIFVQIINVTLGIIVKSEVLITEDTDEQYWQHELDGTFSETVNYIAGHVYKLRIVFEIQEVDNTAFDYGFFDCQTSLTLVPSSSSSNVGKFVFLQEMFNIKVVDWYKDLLNQFCITPQTDGFTKVVTLNYFDDLTNNIPFAKDWSDLVDTRSFPMQFDFGKYGQTNSAKYKENATVTLGYGDSTFNVDNVNLQPEFEAIKMNTSATESYADADFDVIPNIKMLKSPSNNEVNNRLLLISGTQEVTITDGTISDTFDIQVAYFDKAGQAVNLPFDKILQTNYQTILAMLEKTKNIQLMVKLSATDVQNFDFSIPIFINVQHNKVYANGYFYVNTISQFKGGLTKIFLTRI